MADVLAEAVRRHRQGDLEAAARLYEQALALAPGDADAWHLLGVVHHQRGRHARAAELIERAVALRPEAAEMYVNLAEARRALGEGERAVESCRTALRLRPDLAAAWHNLGLALRGLGRHEEALTAFRRAGELAPDDAQARGNLGLMLLGLGRAEEALEHCRAAARLRPQTPLLHVLLGDALRAVERPAEAREAYLEALRLQPDLAQAHAGLGMLYLAGKQPLAALPALERAVALAPGRADFWKPLAEAHEEAEEHAEAAACWRRALALQPGQAAWRLGLGSALLAAGRFAEAEEEIRAALRSQPASAAAHYGLGTWHEQRGDAAAAEAAYREALRLGPGFTLARVSLLRLLRGRLPDADRRAVAEQLADAQTPDVARARLLFGLAGVFDARGDAGAAAECARRANALCLERSCRRGAGYDPEAHRLFVEKALAAFGEDFFRRTAGAGLETRRPVFVFGLSRSGTTLIEQILASHSRAHGAGELPLGWRSLLAVPAAVGRDGGDPLECVAALDGPALRRLGEQHLARLSAHHADAERIVDKMPDNYQYVGLLAALFPRAAFIHCRRDLRDVAVSCWLTDFQHIDWTNDFEHIASRFAEYERLLARWRRVLPVPLHEVDYEEVVEDLEGQARRLVAACGLEWEPACLEFHRTRRPVRTASAAQVRVPIYTSSVGRWRLYERELAELFARLPNA
jgi:tetratricopeptide (TPR) repeat protein